MTSRERRSWTLKEDQLLREAVQKEDPNTQNPSKWHAIAKHVPDRTNKDCRKRWFAKMASDVVKGGWAPDEDERLVKAIEHYGTRWSLVASQVCTRNSDQCAKRWTDTLNPAIDRTSWTPEADALLLSAVNEHGKLWTKIVKTYFPGRTGLAAKNRYNSITRFNSDRSRRPSKSSSSGSSSSGDSPVTPSLSIPDSHFPLPPTGVKTEPASFDLGWSDLSPYSSSPTTYSSSPTQYAAFPEDNLIQFPAESSPYATHASIPSPYSSTSESSIGYENAYSHSYQLSSAVADHHWQSSYDNWDRHAPRQAVGYSY